MTRRFADHDHQRTENAIMQIYITLQPLVALIAGILIIMIPRLLNYIVAIYLVVTGILGLIRM